MNHFEDASPHRLIRETLERLESRVARMSEIGRLNALLTLADQAFVLPRPALALVQLDPMPSTSLGSRHVLRSSAGWAAVGELVFTPVSAGAEVHPWRVTRAAWASGGSSDPAGPAGAYVRGLTLDLERDSRQVCSPGWITLQIEGGPCVPAQLDAAQVHCGGRRLRMRRATAALTSRGHSIPSRQWPLYHEVEALLEGVIEVELPRVLVRETHLTLDVRFMDPVPAQDPPSVLGNVLLAWNTLDHRYPDEPQVTQTVSEGEHRLVHPLEVSSLGDDWQAWDVTRVGRAGRTGELRRGEGEVQEYQLAFVPGEHWLRSDAMRRPRLSVVLPR